METDPNYRDDITRIGWQNIKSDSDYDEKEVLNRAILAERGIGQNTINDGNVDNPSYTTNIEDAWKLVEEIKDYMGFVQLNFSSTTNNWTFEMAEPDEFNLYGDDFCARAMTAPLAIAKCYYEWKTYDRTTGVE